METTTIKITRQELIIIQDLVSKERFKLMALDVNDELDIVKDLNLRLYKKVKQKLTRYYEVDLDNCKMTNKMWVEELAKCMIDSDDYVKDFNLKLKQYNDERNA